MLMDSLKLINLKGEWACEMVIVWVQEVKSLRSYC